MGCRIYSLGDVQDYDVPSPDIMRIKKGADLAIRPDITTELSDADYWWQALQVSTLPSARIWARVMSSLGVQPIW